MAAIVADNYKVTESCRTIAFRSWIMAIVPQIPYYGWIPFKNVDKLIDFRSR